MAKEDPMLNPDMTKYYYPPGATEPVLRPEAVNAPELESEKVEGQGVKADDYSDKASSKSVAKKK